MVSTNILREGVLLLPEVSLLSFFWPYLVVVRLGFFIIARQVWKSRLSSWPLLAWVETGIHNFFCGITGIDWLFSKIFVILGCPFPGSLTRAGFSFGVCVCVCAHWCFQVADFLSCKYKIYEAKENWEFSIMLCLGSWDPWIVCPLSTFQSRLLFVLYIMFKDFSCS